MRRAIILVLLVGCASAPQRSSAPQRPSVPRRHSVRAAPRSAPRAAQRESRACRHARLAILRQVKQSQLRRCEDDRDCVTVMSPGSPVDEYRLVAHRDDGARLDRAAQAHLDRCGAFHHHEPLDAIHTVQAKCVEGRCQPHATALHVGYLAPRERAASRRW